MVEKGRPKGVEVFFFHRRERAVKQPQALHRVTKHGLILAELGGPDGSAGRRGAGVPGDARALLVQRARVGHGIALEGSQHPGTLRRRGENGGHGFRWRGLRGGNGCRRLRPAGGRRLQPHILGGNRAGRIQLPWGSGRRPRQSLQRRNMCLGRGHRRIQREGASKILQGASPVTQFLARQPAIEVRTRVLGVRSDERVAIGKRTRVISHSGSEHGPPKQGVFVLRRDFQRVIVVRHRSVNVARLPAKWRPVCQRRGIARIQFDGPSIIRHRRFWVAIIVLRDPAQVMERRTFWIKFNRPIIVLNRASVVLQVDAGLPPALIGRAVVGREGDDLRERVRCLAVFARGQQCLRAFQVAALFLRLGGWKQRDQNRANQEG